MSKLCDPQNMRLVADGTYRLTRETYCLISLGTMSKVRPRGKKGWWADRDFSAQFHELVLGLVTIESEHSYRHLTQGFCACLEQLCHIDPAGNVLQDFEQSSVHLGRLDMKTVSCFYSFAIPPLA